MIYFASPAEVLFDDAGQLQASKDGLVSAAWLDASICRGLMAPLWQGMFPPPTKMVGSETGISFKFLFFEMHSSSWKARCMISLAGIMLASS